MRKSFFLFFIVFPSVLFAKSFKIIAISDPTVTTHYLNSGDFRIGITDNGGGILNNITLPGKGDIMDVQTDMYGRAGQIAIRDASHGGRYNPTQAGFFETLGTQCEVIETPDKLTVTRHPLSLWHGDGKYDFIEWENIGADPYKKDNGNSDIDGLDESKLEGKQETEVASEFDYFGTYENVKGKFGIESPAIRHYIEISFIREPGHCINQFREGTKLFNEKALAKDISKKFPEGVHKGTSKDMNGLISIWSLRHDRAKWVHSFVHYRTADGQWKTQPAENDLSEESDNTVIILSDSSSLKNGTALGLYRPKSDINEYFIIGRNEKTNKTEYKDQRYTAANDGTRITYSYKRTPTLAKYGFANRCTGMINRTALKKDVYEVFRGEYYILQGTPEEIMATVKQIDKAGDSIF